MRAPMVTIGLLLWFATQVMALLMTGGGHGWYGGILLSLPLAILYPLGLARSVSKTRSPAADIVILAAAIILDLLLIGSTALSGDGYFRKIWAFDRTFVAIWIALWAGWQVPFVASLAWRALCRAPAQSV